MHQLNNKMKHLKNILFAALGVVLLAACNGKDPIYWFEQENANGSGTNIPYYPDKNSNGGGVANGGYAPSGYNVVWSDEFDSQVKLYTQWTFEKGGTGWGNEEKQYYCDGGLYEPTGQQTAFVSDGTLKIKAYKITPSYASDNQEFISARINTKESWQYGYIEMRAKMPKVKGCWPAFWMLLSDGPSYVRDASKTGAEIDILEYVPGDDPNTVHFSAHSYNATPEAGRDTGYIDPETGKKYSYTDNTRVQEAGDWHCYGMEWTHDYIKGFCDGVEYFYIPNPTPNVPDLATWPFDQKFYLKLNLAIGGSWGGTPDPNFTDATYEIDWVRVYQKAGAPDTTVEDLLTSTPWELVKVTEDWGDGSADMTDAAGNKITFNKDKTLSFDCTANGGKTHDYYFSGEDFEPYGVNQMAWSLGAGNTKLNFTEGSFPLVILNEGAMSYNIDALDETQLVISVEQWGEKYSITFKPASTEPTISELLTAKQWVLKGVLEGETAVSTSVGNKLTLNTDGTMSFDCTANEGKTFDHTWEGALIAPNAYGEVSAMRWSTYADDEENNYISVSNGFLLVFIQEDVAGTYLIKELTSSKLTVEITTYEETWTILFDAVTTE